MPSTNNTSIKRVCVIGGGGAIGSHLVEGLVNDGVEVRALVRNLGSAVRIGRFKLDLRHIDLLSCSVQKLSEIFSDCDVVIDCSYSKESCIEANKLESEQGATKILQACEAAQVRQLIHYGTISVYPSNVTSINEETSCVFQDNGYADGKLSAENVLLEHDSSTLSIWLLQLPVVIGPYMNWTASTVSQMSGQTLLFPRGLKGNCPHIDVADVVAATKAAILKGDSHSGASTQKILLHHPDSRSWLEFYQAHSLLSDELSVDAIDAESFESLNKLADQSSKPWVVLKRHFSQDGDFRQLILAQWGVRHLYSLVKRRKGQQGLDKIKQNLSESVASGGVTQDCDNQALLPPHLCALFNSMPGINSNKAARVLDWQPTLTFERSLNCSQQWLRWANLID